MWRRLSMDSVNAVLTDGIGVVFTTTSKRGRHTHQALARPSSSEAHRSDTCRQSRSSGLSPHQRWQQTHQASCREDRTTDVICCGIRPYYRLACVSWSSAPNPVFAMRSHIKNAPANTAAMQTTTKSRFRSRSRSYLDMSSLYRPGRNLSTKENYHVR